MLVRITEKCRMGCPHCLVSSHAEGRHMDWRTFVQALDFAQVDHMILVSGGEPTEHPMFIKMVTEAKRQNLAVMVLSNGMFTENNKLTQEILNLDVPVQVSVNERFYPIKVNRVDHKLLTYVDNPNSLTPLGRARGTPGMETPGSAPKCYNLRSATRYYNDILAGLRRIRMAGKFCTPSIDFDGTIRAGESNECFAIGNVRRWSAEGLTRKLLEHDCDACGLHKNLTTQHLDAVGSKRVCCGNAMA